MIYELSHFLNIFECKQYIENINKNTTCIPFTNSGKFTNNKWNDEKLANIFYEKLQNYNIENDNTIIRPNKIIMSGKYNIGDSFSLHTDTGLYYNLENREKTQWTLLIYLNDDFNGGETVFYDNNWNITKIIIPKMGKAILFDINLWHKGNQIMNGEKYWIGCEIIGKF
jgi:hypothetical protein